MGVKIQIVAPGAFLSEDGSDHIKPVLRGWEGVVSDEDAAILIAGGSAVKAADGDRAEDTEPDLSKLTVQELREIADERRVDLGEAQKKAEIVAAIEAQDDDEVT